MKIDHVLIHALRARTLFRRYFVTNGFDGALTMLGMLAGFYASGMNDVSVALTACMGAAIALFMSGVSSAYLSEKAERAKELQELEHALIHDLGNSDYGQASRYLPIFVALVNGLSPLIMSMLIISPLFLARAGFALPISPFALAIIAGCACIFAIGVFLGKISDTFCLLSGVYTLLIAMVTLGCILLVSSLVGV